MNRVRENGTGRNYENRIGLLTRQFSPATISIRDEPASSFKNLLDGALGMAAVLRDHQDETIQCLCLELNEVKPDDLNTKHLPVFKFSCLHDKSDEEILAFARTWGLLSAWDGCPMTFEPLMLWRLESALLRLVMIFGDAVASTTAYPRSEERLGEALVPCIEKARPLLPLVKPFAELGKLPALYAGFIPILENRVAHVIEKPSDYKDAVTQIVNYRLYDETRVQIEPRAGFMPVIRPKTLLGALYTRLVFRWQGQDLQDRACQNCGAVIHSGRSAKTRFCDDMCRTEFHNDARRRAKILRAREESRSGR
jgi:hypothetical protein